MTRTILLAGATGDLGARIARELLTHDVQLRVLTRPGTDTAQRSFGGHHRVDIVTASYTDHNALTTAMAGVDVVVSAVSGVRPVIIDAQRALLKAAVAAGIRRFIPSDYSADYRRITPGTNRNFELRREFAADLDTAPIQATSILSGMFTDLLTGEAPMIMFKQRLVLFWSSADQLLDFTTKDDAARTTALAAVDDDAPRVVEVAGSHISARDVARIMTALTRTQFKVQWAGTAGTLSAMSKVVKKFAKNPNETFPAWQGMQYFVSMFSGEAELRHLDNDRYGPHDWTTVEDVLRAHLSS